MTELIARAPWREAVTYRETWPHEYVLTEKDNQRELLAAVCERFRAGEGVASRFFRMENTYLFIGEYKYWLMTGYNDVDSYNDESKTLEIHTAEASKGELLAGGDGAD